MTPGAVLFARFAYPPNSLGYCGPDDHLALLEYGAAGVSDGGLLQLARAFEGAWPYLELIAAANGIDDPFHERVVEAYWVGNRLLEQVSLPLLGASLEERFRTRVGRHWPRLVDSVPVGALPHHSFHVFGVYPWVGQLRAGMVNEPLEVLDRCRIRWGRVVKTAGDQVEVRSRRLTWDRGCLKLGPIRHEWATAARSGLGFVSDLQPGDWVALHWDWVCDRLTTSRLRALQHYSNRQLALVNRVQHPPDARRGEGSLGDAQRRGNVHAPEASSGE
jgi:hypothetical protein